MLPDPFSLQIFNVIELGYTNTAAHQGPPLRFAFLVCLLLLNCVNYYGFGQKLVGVV